MLKPTGRRYLRVAAAALVLLGVARAGVLPDDRADLMYHRYEGGGLTVDGPSVLVRKKFGDHFSAAYNYYVDMISSASIDVVTQASPYTETRTQNSLSVDAIDGKSTYSAGYIYSKEPDYKAQTAFASVSQDMFGDLTTVTFGYTRGWDKVGERGTPRNDSVDHHAWNVGVTQVLTRNLLLDVSYEATNSQGYLSNPYRQARYLDPTEPLGYAYEKQVYPENHSGNAGAAVLKYYLPWRAALTGTYRYYSDNWGIHAQTGELGYTQPAWRAWTFDGHVRYYHQNHADFYSDLYSYAGSQNYLGRDRELATFDSVVYGIGATWEYRIQRFAWLQKGTVNFTWNRMHISYDDFRNLEVQNVPPGTEPLYTLDADIFQAFVSFWF